MDGTFDGVEAEYKEMGQLAKAVEKDVVDIVSSLTTLSNASASLAVHMRQAEPLLRTGLGTSEAAALQTALIKFYDTQKLVTRKIVSGALQDMKGNAYEPLVHAADTEPRVASAIQRRNNSFSLFSGMQFPFPTFPEPQITEHRE